MKLQEIVTSLKQEVFKAQQELIEQGWDDVNVSNSKHDNALKVTTRFAEDWAVDWIVTQLPAGELSWKKIMVDDKSIYPYVPIMVDPMTTAKMLAESKRSLAWFNVHELADKGEFKFAIKPATLADVKNNPKHTIDILKLKRLIDEKLINVYNAASMFSTGSSGYHPALGLRQPLKEDYVAIVEIYDEYYLVDLTGANTYISHWAYIRHK